MSTPAQVAADLANLAAETSGRVHLAVVETGAKLLAKVRSNASGRPGPEAPTGNYRRSINRLTTRTATASQASVGTNAPQGRRLEFGFVGTDSLGRNYAQPAYPHFGPALDEIAPGFEKAVRAAGLPGK